MTVTINLSPETERRLRERASRKGQTLEDFLESMAREAVGASPASLTPDEWTAQFRAWIASHSPYSGFIDDSRESIYEGRGA